VDGDALPQRSGILELYFIYFADRIYGTLASALLLVVGHNRFRIGHLSQCIDSRVNRNKRIRCNGPGMIYVTEARCSNHARASIYLVASNVR